MGNAKQRIILTTSGMGKTYLDNSFDNVYDFDKHTLECKYNRQDYPHLNDEEFKGLQGRKLREDFPQNLFNLFDNYISSGTLSDYSVILGWGNTTFADYLNNYKLSVNKTKEIVAYEFEDSDDIKILNERFARRGNINYKEVSKEDINKVANQIRKGRYGFMKGWILTKPIFLKEFLVLTGTKLILGTMEYGLKNLLSQHGLFPDDGSLKRIESQLTEENFKTSKFKEDGFKKEEIIFLNDVFNNIKLI